MLPTTTTTVLRTLTVTECKEKANEPGVHVLRLEAQGLMTAFGVSASKEVYRMAVTAPQAVGFKAEVDLNLFEIRTSEFVVEDDSSPINGQTVNLKWLMPKA